MKRLLPSTFTATFAVVAALGAATVSATSADDQAAADAAITAFNDRMSEAGGISRGEPDTEPIGSEPAVVTMDPSEVGTVPIDTALEGEPPGAGSSEPPGAAVVPEFDCFDDFATALDPNGDFEGQTARAFSDSFTFESTEEPQTTDPVLLQLANDDEISAGVITVDADHQALLDEFIATVGSEDVAACLEESIAQSGVEIPGYETEYAVTAETDIGVGDASARLEVHMTSTINDGEPTEFNVNISVARTGRSLAFVNLTNDVPQTSELDPQEELSALLESL